MIDFAVEMGAGRIEIAHVQYYAWALLNRSALMPTREAFLTAAHQVERSSRALQGRHRDRRHRSRLLRQVPEALHGRAGPRGIVNITPSGRVLPCHAAESITGLEFDNIKITTPG